MLASDSRAFLATVSYYTGGRSVTPSQRVALTPGLTLSRALSLVLAPHLQREQIAARCKSHHLVDDWAGSLQRMREITEYLKAINRSNKKNKEDNKEAIMRMCMAIHHHSARGALW